jgi:hypothetical protein
MGGVVANLRACVVLPLRFQAHLCESGVEAPQHASDLSHRHADVQHILHAQHNETHKHGLQHTEID